MGGKKGSEDAKIVYLVFWESVLMRFPGDFCLFDLGRVTFTILFV